MGTIITACMLLALIAAIPYSLSKGLKPLPQWLSVPIGLIVFVAGAWNVFWHAARHITEYWGIAALVSGLLLMITAGYISGNKRMPAGLMKCRPLVLLALLGCMLHYAITIYRL